MHAQIGRHAHTHECTHTRARAHSQTHTYTHTHTHTHTHTRTHACTHARTHTHAWLYVHIIACMVMQLYFVTRVQHLQLKRPISSALLFFLLFTMICIIIYLPMRQSHTGLQCRITIRFISLCMVVDTYNAVVNIDRPEQSDRSPKTSILISLYIHVSAEQFVSRARTSIRYCFPTF